MEKRVFLAIFLSLVVLTLYQALIAPPPRPPVPATPTTTVPPAATTPGAPAVTAPTGVEAKTSAPIGATTSLVGVGGRDIAVETDTVSAVFSTAGATLKSWKLKHYHDGDLPLELVPQDLPPNLPRPFTVMTDDPALSARLATAIFEPSESQLSLGANAGALSFAYRDPQTGLNARKTFHFQPDGRAYVVRVDASVDVGGAAKPTVVHWGAALDRGYHPDGTPTVPFPRALLMNAGSVERLSRRCREQATRARWHVRFRRRRRALLPHRRAAGQDRGARRIPPDRPAGTERSEGADAQLHRLQRASARSRVAAVLHRAEGIRHAAAPSTRSSCARSTSACSRGSSCRCSRR